MSTLEKMDFFLALTDPTLSPYPYLYYLCDRDPTASEPLTYTGYPGLIYIWINTSTNDIFWCLDNTADAMIWNKMVDSHNISSILTALGIETLPVISGTANQIVVTTGSGTLDFSTPQDINISSSPTFAGINLSGLTAGLPLVSNGSKDLVSMTYVTFKSNLGFNINTSRSPTSITPPSFNTARQPNTTQDVFVSSNIAFSAILTLAAEVHLETSIDNSTWVIIGKAKQQLGFAANIIQQICALVPAGSYYRFTLSGTGATIDSIIETQF